MTDGLTMYAIWYSLSVEPVIVSEALFTRVFKMQVKVFRINSEVSFLGLTFHRLPVNRHLGPYCLQMLSADN